MCVCMLQQGLMCAYEYLQYKQEDIQQNLISK